MQRGFISHPIVNLSPFFESRRSEYLELLRQVSTNGAWVDWVEFFLTAVAVQADDACKRADALLRLRQEYEERARMHVRSRVRTDAIVFSLERVFVTAGELALFAHCNYRTARSALEGLAHAGILVSLADVYPQAWVASEVYELVYGDI